MNKKNLAPLVLTLIFIIAIILVNKQTDSIMVESNKKLDLEINNEIIIAVVDSGLDTYNFDSLQVIEGFNAISDSAPIDPLGHGTKVTNVISDYLKDTVSPKKLENFKIMPIKVFDDVGKTTDKYIIDGINAAVNKGATIINLSFKAERISKELIDALQYALDKNVVLVMCAIDNNDSSDLSAISKLPIIWVDSEDNSNAKDKRLLTLLTTPYKDYKGASFAVPQVTSTVAVMKGVNLNLQPHKIREILTKTALNKSEGIGRLNITEALKNTK